MTKDELSNFALENGSDIYGFCYYLSGSKDKAEDLYQETFLKTTEKIKKISTNNEVKSYVLGIAVRLWKNQVKKEKNRQRIVLNNRMTLEETTWIKSNEDTILERVVEDEQRRFILNCMELLDIKQKTVIVMFYYNNLTIEEIAKSLKIPKGTVKSRLFKGRENIAKLLEVQGYEY